MENLASLASLAPASPVSPAPPAAASRRRPRIPKLKHPSLRVLSIDVGLRNLGMAVVKIRGVDQEVYQRILATPRLLISHHIEVEMAENVDVLEENSCTAKNAKSIGPLKQVSFFHASMLRRSAQILDPPPDVIVVEVQDGGNSTMRQVSTGIVGLFMGHFEALLRSGHIAKVPTMTMIRGDMKMKICNMILNRESEPEEPEEPQEKWVTEAAGTETGAGATEASVAGSITSTTNLPPEYLKRVNPKKYYALLRTATEGKLKSTAGRSRKAYEQRKKTAVLAFDTYMDQQLASNPSMLCESLRSSWVKATAKKKRDISDAVLQGMYVIGRELKVDMGVRM